MSCILYIYIMVRHLAECNTKANLGKNIENHFRKPFLDLECSNFTKSVSRLIRNYCKITFFCRENRPTLKRICLFFIHVSYFYTHILYVFFIHLSYFFTHAEKNADMRIKDTLMRIKFLLLLVYFILPFTD